MSETGRWKGRRDDAQEARAVAGRVPWHDLDAEAAVLSPILLGEPNAVRVVREILPDPKQFYAGANQAVCEAIYAILDARDGKHAGAPIDIVTVASWLRDRDRLAQIGGASYLAQLTDATPAVSHLESHARIVLACWKQREVVRIAQTFAAEGYTGIDDPNVWIRSFREQLLGVERVSQKSTAERIGGVITRVVENIDSRLRKGRLSDAVSSGYPELDRHLGGGLFPGRVTYLAARPGQGKTTLARNIILRVAMSQETNYEQGVVVIQLEGDRNDVGIGLLCTEARVDSNDLLNGTLEAGRWSDVTEAATKLYHAPIWVEDAPSTVDTIVGLVRRIQDEWECEPQETPDGTRCGRKVVLVVVDYTQRVHGRKAVRERKDEIADVSRGLSEDLAKGCGVHVLALAAMNREVEKRKGPPQLSDLRDCGDLESDADYVIFLSGNNGMPDDDEDDGTKRRGADKKESKDPTMVELRFGKNRHAQVAKFNMRFLRKIGTFAMPYNGGSQGASEREPEPNEGDRDGWDT